MSWRLRSHVMVSASVTKKISETASFFQIESNRAWTKLSTYTRLQGFCPPSTSANFPERNFPTSPRVKVEYGPYTFGGLRMTVGKEQVRSILAFYSGARREIALGVK